LFLQENSNKSDTESVDKAERPKSILRVSTTEQDSDIVTADADHDDGGDKFDEVYNSYLYSLSCHYAFYWSISRFFSAFLIIVFTYINIFIQHLTDYILTINQSAIGAPA
jgi:hypothetical protein